MTFFLRQSLQRASVPVSFFLATICGCQEPQSIDVDISSNPLRFIIDHRGWPRPFWAPSVKEFAIATEEEAVWQLEATGSRGEAARELAIVYGEAPAGFRQVFPEKAEKPKPLQRGRMYFVAAGGRSTVYRMVFSLPMDPLEVRRPPTTGPGS